MKFTHALVTTVLVFGNKPYGETPDLQGEILLYSDKVLVGEPLVITVTLTNRGDKDFKTAYYTSDHFQNAGSAFTVTTNNQAIISRETQVSCIWVVEPDERFLAFPGARRPIIVPQGSVKAKKVFCSTLRRKDGMAQFLGPGKYEIECDITLWGRPTLQVRTRPRSFTVEELPEEAAGALDVFTPALSILLEGTWGTPTDAMVAVADDLRKKFPTLPHRKYLDYRMLDLHKNDREAYRLAAQTYLRVHPDSPFVDEIRFRLEQLEVGD